MAYSEEEYRQMMDNTSNKNKTNYANRGQNLEQMIEQANQHYSFQKRALIQKIPTPVKVLDINSKTGKITNGFYEQKSTVDYIGTYQGYPIAFDAKETSIETRFDLSNVKEHQYQYLKEWHDNGGIAFLIVYFKTQDEIYYLSFQELQYWAEEADRKSIPYDSFEHEISENGLVLLDYLSVLREVLKC